MSRNHSRDPETTAPDHHDGTAVAPETSWAQRLSSWIRLRLTLLAIRADRLATVLFASAASFIGVDALFAVLGVTASFPIAFPMVIVGLALLAVVHPLAVRLRRLVRGRSRG